MRRSKQKDHNGFTLVSLLLLRKRSCKGFTLVELLVVISIITILAVIGVMTFRGITSSANDTKRKNDVKAIASAFERNYSSTSGLYQALAGSDFSSGNLPQKPEGGDYNIFTNANSSGFRVCAALDSNPSGNPCDTPTSTCFCVSSSQSQYIAGAPTSTPIPTITGPTSTPTPTSVPPTSTPIPTATPIPCVLTSATWGVTNIIVGNVVGLNVAGNSQCVGQQVTFEVRRNGTPIDDISAQFQPSSATMNGLFQATTTWIAERNPLFPFTDPDYYFKATPQVGATIDTKPQLLTVVAVPTSTPTPTTPPPTSTPTPTATPIPPTPTPGSSAIFLDGFESNDFTAWSGGGNLTATRTTGPTFALTGINGAQFAVNSAVDSGFYANVYSSYTAPTSNKVYLKAQIKVNAYTSAGYNIPGSKSILTINDSSGNRMAWLNIVNAWSIPAGKNQMHLKGGYRSKSGVDTAFGTNTPVLDNNTYNIKIMIDKSGANPAIQYWVDAATYSAIDATAGVDGVGRTFGRGYFGINNIVNNEKGVYTFSLDQCGVYDTDPG